MRRLLWMIPLLWAVATITFFLMHAVPGGPFDQEKKLPPQVLANLNAKYNLDKPLLEQYVLYLWDLVPLKADFPPVKTPDLGVSFRTNQPVQDRIEVGFKVTAQLGVVAFLYALVIGMSLGVIAALNQNRMGDYLGVFFATIGTALPSFIIATFLVVIFSVKLGWFTVLGWGGPPAFPWDAPFWDPGNWHIRQMVLPVISLGTLPAAYIARITRASLLEVLGQDYIRTARSKGLTEWVVILRHTVKNALVPVLTVIGPIFAFLVTGSFIVEQIFSIPGVGRAFVRAVFDRDYGMIMGTVLFYAVIVAVANLVVDVLYAAVDPRIRYG